MLGVPDRRDCAQKYDADNHYIEMTFPMRHDESGKNVIGVMLVQCLHRQY
ncbi:MAG: hypothetical protein ACLTDV_02895 [Eubacterium sp.]